MRVQLPDPGGYLFVARAGTADGRSGRDSVAVTVLPNGAPVIVSVAVHRCSNGTPCPLVVEATDEAEVQVTWLVGEAEIGTTVSGDTLWWTPGGAVGERTLLLRVVDPQGYFRDSAVAARVLDGSWVRWTAAGVGRGYGDVITDWGGMTALAPSGDIAVSFYNACASCLLVYSPAGQLRWQAMLDDQIGDHSAGLTYAADGSLFVFVYGGWVYRFGEGGSVVRRRQALGRDPHGRFPVDPAGRLFVAANLSTGAGLLRLDPATGAEVWRVPGSVYSAGPTVLSGGTIGAQLGAVLLQVDSGGAPVADTLAAEQAHYMSAADARGHQYLSERGCTPCVNGLTAVGPDHTVR